ncbi:hypothetical protein LTR94_032788, partial [Friedmanniomyces endolithicus]
MRSAQDEALASRDRMVSAHKEVQEAEQRIRELEAELQHMSELVREDQLTGSLNRRGLDDVFERESARADRRKTPLCVALLDLDNFQDLNDRHGHVQGDALLRGIAAKLLRSAGSQGLAARTGSDEFALLLPGTDEDGARRRAELLHDTLREPLVLDGVP